MQFSQRECQVMRQLFAAMRLANSRTVAEEIANLDNAPYVVGFRPGPGQIRLDRQEWSEFVRKLQKIIRDEVPPSG